VSVVGILLAAGAGRRMGRPKGLLREADGAPWVARAAGVLAQGGCDPVLVVVGAEAAKVSALVPAPARAVVASDWAEGMSASLRAGLEAAAELPPSATAALLMLVDTPGITPAAITRLAALATPSTLARTAYGGVPGHPVLLGREHWDAVAATASGDAGARAYLRTRDVTLVESADVASGADLDTPDQLPHGTTSLE
jgi:CTP:molybdopterin cytidylyltransferase MocA